MQLRLWLSLSRDMVRILRIVCAICFCHPMALIVTMQLDATVAVVAGVHVSAATSAAVTSASSCHTPGPPPEPSDSTASRSAAMSTATAMSPGSTHGSVQGCGLDCPQPEVKRQRADRQPHQAPGGGASLDHHRTRHVAERGELAEALALAKRLLGQHPGLAEYREVRELSRRLGIWQESCSELLAQWATARQYDLLTDVYLEEGEIDQVLKLVKQYSCCSAIPGSDGVGVRVRSVPH